MSVSPLPPLTGPDTSGTPADGAGDANRVADEAGVAVAAGAATSEAATTAAAAKPARRRRLARPDRTHGWLNIIVRILVGAASGAERIRPPRKSRTGV